MRILHVLDHSIPLHSGYTFRTRSILEQQRALGWETFHVTSSKHSVAAKIIADEEEVNGFHFYRTPLPSSPFAAFPVLSQLAVIRALEKRLREAVRTVKPDIIHAHSPALNGVAAVNVGKSEGIPVVYEIRAFWEDAAVDHGTSTEWGLRYRLTRRLETFVLKRADAVTTICEGLRNEIIQRGIPNDIVTVIPNAVDATSFNVGGQADAELARQLGLEGKQVIGFIGSFYAYEGLALLIEALPELLKANPNVRLLLVGGGPQDENLQNQATALGLNDAVIFTGRVPHDQVQRYYDLVDILVYPRLPMRLTELVTPLKPLEAMAQGRLVVASDVGGHRELIRPGETGELFPSGNAAALAQTVTDLLRARERWPQLREAARRYVEEERNWPKSVARYQEVYGRLVGTPLPDAEPKRATT